MKIRLWAMVLLLLGNVCWGQIPAPNDAPQPLSPDDAMKTIRVPDGFRMELMASEPLIQEPSGVCWDEHGRLFVTELHGFNLEGQFDVDELNKTGQLDRIPRRIPASDEAVKKAQAGIFGVVKLLLDDNGDGKYDRAEVWADDLPPCYGACPARGGIVVCCAPQIVFLADRDGDNKVDEREVLFSGLPSGLIDRGVNSPQWGNDGWIYFGQGNTASTVTGPNLGGEVKLPHTDFRIRPDGSAIEPVLGHSYTFGFSFTGLGDRIVTSTRTPAICIAPLSWNSLARNPLVAIPNMQADCAYYQEIFPISQPHPWRSKRASDPGFSKFYTSKYGAAESAPSGYLTSACSPIVYQDSLIPTLKGQILTCEPAQNLIHRSQTVRDGSRIRVQRVPGEERSEFLTSTDSWFHPIAISHAPDGSMCVTDFYREIIEDYSAVPRYLQQIYGVVNGKDRGRLWRLTHAELPKAPDRVMSRLSDLQLVEELSSDYYWRRETAGRLLVERNAEGVIGDISQQFRSRKEARISYTLFSILNLLGGVTQDDLLAGLFHESPEIRRLALQHVSTHPVDAQVWRTVIAMLDDESPLVRLQLSSTLGDAPEEIAVGAIAKMARKYGDEIWMPESLLSSVRNQSDKVLIQLLETKGLAKSTIGIVESLASIVGADGNSQALASIVHQVSKTGDHSLQARCLSGLQTGLAKIDRSKLELPSSIREDLQLMSTRSKQREVRESSRKVMQLLALESGEERTARLRNAEIQLTDPAIESAVQIAAVEQLIDDGTSHSYDVVLDSLSRVTPQVRESSLALLLSRPESAMIVLNAIESKQLAASNVPALQRDSLMRSKNSRVRQSATRLFAESSSVDPKLLQTYLDALQRERDAEQGVELFRQKCASCHRAHGVGQSVGPDLTSEFQRAEESMVRDLLAPSDAIAAGYASYIVLTTNGQTFTGLITAEGPTSVTLRQSEGKETTVLRSEIDEMRLSSVSMMPDDLAKQVTPVEFANILSWLRRPTKAIVLLDDSSELLSEFREGDGVFEMQTDDVAFGLKSLSVTPLQRSNSRIHNWQFRIRENPTLGEYRYLRFSWKVVDAHGAMLELAANGNWPPAQKAIRRYYSGQNSTNWSAVEISPQAPGQWTTVTRDLWRESGDFDLTGIAPTALGGRVLFDRIELLQSQDE